MDPELIIEPMHHEVEGWAQHLIAAEADLELERLTRRQPIGGVETPAEQLDAEARVELPRLVAAQKFMYCAVPSSLGAFEYDPAGVQHQRFLAQVDDRRHVMANEEDGDALAECAPSSTRHTCAETADVPDAQDFVDQQDFGLEVGGDREAETRLHARGIRASPAYR